MKKYAYIVVVSGEAHKKYGAEFNSIILEKFAGVDQGKIKELIERIPSYLNWQGEHWFSHCNDVCAFIGDLKESDIKSYKDELTEDLEEQAVAYRLTVEEYIDELINGRIIYFNACITENVMYIRICFESIYAMGNWWLNRIKFDDGIFNKLVEKM
ncbi:CbrC family protein [Brevibacillus laterosporus]